MKTLRHILIAVAALALAEDAADKPRVKPEPAAAAEEAAPDEAKRMLRRPGISDTSQS
jgi:hypothetical protein